MKSGQKMTQLDFRITVAKSLLDGHIRKPELPLRLTERPFIEPIPKLTEYGGRPNAMSVAKESRHHINVKCVRTPLCLYPCFEAYHTQRKVLTTITFTNIILI